MSLRSEIVGQRCGVCGRGLNRVGEEVSGARGRLNEGGPWVTKTHRARSNKYTEWVLNIHGAMYTVNVPTKVKSHLAGAFCCLLLFGFLTVPALCERKRKGRRSQNQETTTSVRVCRGLSGGQAFHPEVVAGG